MQETIQVVPSIENDASLSPTSSAAPTSASSNPADLDPSIVRAAELGFAIAPVLTHSRAASARSCIGAPTNDIDLIAEAAAQYPQCNWTLHVGSSGVVILEVDKRIGYVSLSTLCRNSFGRWTKTLQFMDATSRFLIFRSSEQRGRSVGQQFQGLNIHAGNAFLLIPPSSFGGSGGLAYIDINAAIIDTPDFLLAEPSSRESKEMIPNSILAA